MNTRKVSLLVWGGIVFFWMLFPAGAKAKVPFDPQKSRFSVKVAGHVSSYQTMSFFVLPQEQIQIEVRADKAGAVFKVPEPAVGVEQSSPRLWRWRSPANNGNYKVSLEEVHSGEKMTLHFFVMIPYSDANGRGTLNGYRIGAYPTIPLKQLPMYRPPRGFVEVTAENVNMKVSPHFQLHQFLCKQKGGFPKYLVLRSKLLLKLELLLEQVNALGYRCDSFNVLSGYRTPYYNRVIGNVKYSRHLWGGAADIFVDESPKDNYMDDLNKDGFINWKDAKIIYDIIDANYGKPFYDPFVGGLGRYRKTSNHPPFVHVDVRGRRARWGE